MRKQLFVCVVVFCLLLAAVVYLGAQAGGGQPYLWVWTGSGWRLWPATGNAITVGSNSVSINATPSKEYTFGSGFDTAEVAGTNQVTVTLNSAYVLYRAVPPTTGGPCSLGGGANGQGLLSFGTDKFLYACMPTAPGTNGQQTVGIWGRMPVDTDFKLNQ